MHNVGNTIWIISTERPGVLPFLVVEEVIKKSISGTETSYMVQVPGNKGSPKKLSKIAGEVYPDKTAAKSALMSRAEKAIDDMLSKGQIMIDEQPQLVVNSDNALQPEKELVDDLDSEFVTLPDGSRAKVNFRGDLNDNA